MTGMLAAALAASCTLLLAAGYALGRLTTRRGGADGRDLGTPVERATFTHPAHRLPGRAAAAGRAH